MSAKSKKKEQFPGLRFSSFSGNWSRWCIGELGTVTGGGTPDTSRAEYWNGSVNWFTPTEITKKYLSESRRKLSQSGVKKSSAKILPVGTLLITSRATVGRTAIIKTESATNQGFQSLTVSENFSNEFAYYWLEKNVNEILRRANGSTFLEISNRDLKG